MTIEEIVALDATFTERARMIRAHDPTLSGKAIARLLGCGTTTVQDAFKPIDEVNRRKHPRKSRPSLNWRSGVRTTGNRPSGFVARVTVEQDGALWFACVNGHTWGRGHLHKRDAEREAEWLRWPKTEKGKAA